MPLDVFENRSIIKYAIFFQTINKCNEKLDSLNKEKEKLNSIIKKARGNRELTCLHCNSNYKIKELIYIQTYWFKPPSGCTEGGYPIAQEGYFICSNCNTRNRFLDSYELPYDYRKTMINPLVRFNRYYKCEFKDRIDKTKEHEKLRFVNITIGKDFIVEE